MSQPLQRQAEDQETRGANDSGGRHGLAALVLPFPTLRPAAYRPADNRHRASPLRKAGSFLLAAAIEVLLLLAFFTLNWRDRPAPRFEGGQMKTFDIAAESEQDR